MKPIIPMIIPAIIATVPLPIACIRKAISYGKLVEGVDVCKFGKQWVVSTAAMKREYGEPRV